MICTLTARRLEAGTFDDFNELDREGLAYPGAYLVASRTCAVTKLSARDRSDDWRCETSSCPRRL